MKFVASFLSAFFFVSVQGQPWKQYEDSAQVFKREKNPEKAIVYFTKAYNLVLGDSAFTDAHAKLCRQLAELHLARSQYRKAEALYLEARSVIEKQRGRLNRSFAGSTDTLGRVYLLEGAYADAEDCLLESKNIWESLGLKTSPEYARVCNNLGGLYITTGDYTRAEAFHLEAKRIREKMIDQLPADYAQSCNNLANFYWTTGQYEKAEPLAIIAKETRERVLGKKDPAYAISCTNLANIYRDLGQYDKAEALYTEAKDVREQAFTKDNALYASSCNVLADLYYFKQDYAKAEALYLEAKDTRQRVLGANSYDYAQSCNNLATLYRDMGQFDKAELLALQAKQVYELKLPKDHPSHAINNNNLGELYFAMGRYREAEEYFLLARKFWEATLGKEHQYYSGNAKALARLYWNLSSPNKAAALYVQALNTQFAQLNKVFRFTNEAEKELYLRNINGSGDEYQSFYYQNGNRSTLGWPYLIALQNRNLLLSSSQKMRQLIYNSNDEVLLKKFDAWLALKKQLATLYAKGSSAAHEPVKSLEEEAALIEKELARSSAAFRAQQQKDVSWKRIQQKLRAGEAAIEFIEFRYFNGKSWTDSVFYAALVLRKDLPWPQSVFLFEKSKLDELLNAPSGSTQDNIAVLYTKKEGGRQGSHTPAEVYNLVWKPMEKLLKGISTVYFAPAGNLHRLAFAALPVNERLVLSDQYKLVQLTTTEAITQQPGNYRSLAVNGLNIYGGIVYDADSITLKKAAAEFTVQKHTTRSLDNDVTRGQSWTYLPGTEKEIRAIGHIAGEKHVNTNIREGVGATEESVKAMTGPASPSVLHIATHGFFFPDPESSSLDSLQARFEKSGRAFKRSKNPLLRSGLLLAGANNAWKGAYVDGIEDGILTAYEIADLFLPNTRLVVLSACETALGDIRGSEGVYGLQRAFKMAGVQHLLMSLWKVPDAETAEFMEVFYRNLFGGKTIDAAFYKAQEAMKRKYKSEPYKWAAWVLVR
jgi:CHAT domain-containing protein